MPARFFWIAAFYLVALMALFALYELSPSLFEGVPSSFGPLPFEVPWFGALGGALISLSGIFEHNQKWDPRFNYWHYSRPIVGAAIGSIGALLFFVAVQAANSGETSSLNPAVFDVVALLIGYREQTFRMLIKRMTDLLLGQDGLVAGVPPRVRDVGDELGEARVATERDAG